MKKKEYYSTPGVTVITVHVEKALLQNSAKSNALNDYSLLNSGDIDWDE